MVIFGMIPSLFIPEVGIIESNTVLHSAGLSFGTSIGDVIDHIKLDEVLGLEFLNMNNYNTSKPYFQANSKYQINIRDANLSVYALYPYSQTWIYGTIVDSSWDTISTLLMVDENIYLSYPNENCLDAFQIQLTAQLIEKIKEFTNFKDQLDSKVVDILQANSQYKIKGTFTDLLPIIYAEHFYEHHQEILDSLLELPPGFLFTPDEGIINGLLASEMAYL